MQARSGIPAGFLHFSILPSRDSPPDYESRLPKKFAPAPIYRQQEESFRETDETPENLENPAQSRLHKGRRDIRHTPKKAQKRLLYDQLILKSAQHFSLQLLYSRGDLLNF